MEFSKGDIKILKGIAILFMLLLHLFCRKEVNGLYETFPLINGVPLVYYLALFGDACVPIFCFSSGYGLFIIFNKKHFYVKTNVIRIFKLLVNYWIVLVIFVVIGFFAGKSEFYPGGLVKFFLNFFVLSSSYNGAWWFMQTYIILVLLSPGLFKFIIKYPKYGVLVISISLYLISYIQRFKNIFYLGDNTFLNMSVNAIVLVGTSQLPFVVGAIFAKDKLYSRLYSLVSAIYFKNTICYIGILILLLIHSFWESLVIAPITGIYFICLFNLLDRSNFVNKILNFFGNHSTNIWLTHMFFYLLIFPEITFAPRYPVLIYIWLILLCIISSFLINFLYKPVIRVIDKKIFPGGYDEKEIRTIHI